MQSAQPVSLNKWVRTKLIKENLDSAETPIITSNEDGTPRKIGKTVVAVSQQEESPLQLPAILILYSHRHVVNEARPRRTYNSGKTRRAVVAMTVGPLPSIFAARVRVDRKVFESPDFFYISLERSASKGSFAIF